MGRWEEARETALSRFTADGPAKLNCAQAVLAFAAHGLDQDPRSVVVAGYFGGGGVGMGQICGAVSGMLMSTGLRDYWKHEEDAAAPPGAKDALQRLLEDFEAEFGSVTCRTLTGYDIRTKDGYQAFRSDPVSKRCVDYVGWACDHIRSILGAAV